MEISAFWSEDAQGFVKVEFDESNYTPLIHIIDNPKSKQYSGFRLILKDLVKFGISKETSGIFGIRSTA
jgi:hypothetical protein